MPLEDGPQPGAVMEERFSSLHLDFYLNVSSVPTRELPHRNPDVPIQEEPTRVHTHVQSTRIMGTFILLFLFPTDDVCVHDCMKASHTKVEGKKTPHLSSMFVALLAFKALM